MRGNFDTQELLDGLEARCKILLEECNLASETTSQIIQQIGYDFNASRRKTAKFWREYSNAEVEYRFHRGNDRISLPRSAIFCFAIMSWYAPEDTGILLREALRKEQRRCTETDQIILDILLESKVQMQLYLIETSLWTTSSFFGTILAKKHRRTMTYLDSENNDLPTKKVEFQPLQSFIQHKILHLPRKAKKPNRPRGYRDHGSLLEPHLKREIPEDSGTRQYELEVRRETLQNVSDMLKGSLE